MDAIRFDSLTLSLSVAGSRRRALAAVLGGALGLRRLVHPADAAAGGKCKPACNECEKCHKGPCHKTKHGKSCKQGKCKAKAEGTGCSVGTCQGRACVAPPEPCRGFSTGCTTGAQCCTGTCMRGVCCIAPGAACPPFAAGVCCNPGSGGNAAISCGASHCEIV